MGHSRSQRHLRDIRGYDSNGVKRPGFGSPPITGASPATGTVAYNAAVGTTIVTMVPTGGTAPFSYAVLQQAGVAASFTPNTSAILKTVAQPCAIGPGLSNMVVEIVDSKGARFTKTVVVTRT